jgi:hypothetical protein
MSDNRDTKTVDPKTVVEKVEDAIEKEVVDVLAEIKAALAHAEVDVIGRAHATYEALKALAAKIEAAV